MSCTRPAAASPASSGCRCARSAAVCRAWSSWETGTPGLSGRSAPEASTSVISSTLRSAGVRIPPFSLAAGTVTARALDPSPRSAWADKMVSLGRGLGDDGRSVVSLRPDDLRAAATATTGLDDFGDTWWEEPFRRLCASLDGEARLHLPGRLRTRGEIQLILQNRLRMVELWKREPSVLREARPRPRRRDGAGPFGHHPPARAARLRPRQPAAPAVGAAAHRPLRGRVGRPLRRRDHPHGRDRPRLHRHARERRPAAHRVHLRLRAPVLQRHLHRAVQRLGVHRLAQRDRPGPHLRLAQAAPADAAVGGGPADATAGSSRRPPIFPPCPCSLPPTPTRGW